MAHCNTIFSQLLKLVPRHEFEIACKTASFRPFFSNRIALGAVCDADDGRNYQDEIACVIWLITSPPNHIVFIIWAV